MWHWAVTAIPDALPVPSSIPALWILPAGLLQSSTWSPLKSTWSLDIQNSKCLLQVASTPHSPCDMWRCCDNPYPFAVLLSRLQALPSSGQARSEHGLSSCHTWVCSVSVHAKPSVFCLTFQDWKTWHLGFLCQFLSRDTILDQEGSLFLSLPGRSAFYNMPSQTAIS